MKHILFFLLNIVLLKAVFASPENKSTNMNFTIKPIDSEVMLGQPVLLKLSFGVTSAPKTLDLGYNRVGNFYFKSDGKTFNYSAARGGVSRMPTISITPEDAYTQFLLLDEWMVLKTLGNHSITAFLKKFPDLEEDFSIKIIPFDDQKMKAWVLRTIQEMHSSKDESQKNILFKALQKVPASFLSLLIRDLLKEGNGQVVEVINQVLQTQNKVVTD